MAAITEEQRKVKYQFILEFWQLIKDFDTPEPEQEYWNRLAETTSALADKYALEGDESFFRRLTLAFCEAKDEQFREVKHGK